MSVYDVSTIGTADNQIVFNEYTTFPIYRVVSRSPQQRQIRDYDLPLPFENGVSGFQDLLGSTAYVIAGTMYPGGVSDYDNGLRALRKLSNLDFSQADPSTDTGYVPYVMGDSQGGKQVFLKVLYVNLPENTRQGLVQPFELICKIKDPALYSATLSTVSTQPGAFTVTGGSAAYSFGYPIAYGATNITAQSSTDNQGDIAAYPQSIQVFGPINNPKFINTTTGEFIQVNTNLSSSANVLRISYNETELSVEVDGISVLNQVSNDSTYFKVPPGLSNFSLSGSSTSSDSYAVMTYYESYGL